MFRSKRFAKSLILSLIFLLISTSFVYASSYRTMSTKLTKDPNKVWTVNFNDEVLKRSITNKNIYVEDKDGEEVPVTLNKSSDGHSVTVEPKEPYAEGLYKLYITDDVLSDSKKTLSRGIVMPFKVSPPNYFISIETNYSFLVTNVKVTMDAKVLRVTVNDKEMHYLGGNRYSRGVTDIEQGDDMILKAYDGKGDLLQTLEYRVD